jgi:hypothetical protein
MHFLNVFLAGPEVISLQKEDSLLVFECKGELKRFLHRNAGGIWIKIHLNLRRNFGIFYGSIALFLELKVV